jgi:hypothetical protein
VYNYDEHARRTLDPKTPYRETDKSLLTIANHGKGIAGQMIISYTVRKNGVVGKFSIRDMSPNQSETFELDTEGFIGKYGSGMIQIDGTIFYESKVDDSQKFQEPFCFHYGSEYGDFPLNKQRSVTYEPPRELSQCF